MISLLELATYNWINRTNQELKRKSKRFTNQAILQALFFKDMLYSCYNIKVKNMSYIEYDPKYIDKYKDRRAKYGLTKTKTKINHTS